MKKSRMLIGAMMAAMMCAMPVCAAELNQDSTSPGQTVVSYGIESTYTVTIPADFSFTNTKLESIGNVKASDVLLGDGKKLVVKMTSTNYDTTNLYTLDYGASDVSMIPYFIKTKGTTDAYDVNFVNGSSVLEVEAGTTTKEVNIQFSTTTDDIAKATKSGEHKDTLTFECTVE